MWEINPDSGDIVMHRGDTGAFTGTLTRRSGKPFGENDRAIYTVKSGEKLMLEREFVLDDENLGNGVYLVTFRNSDTDTWPAGTYNTELRVAINPIRNNKVKLTVSSSGSTPITAAIDEDTCLDYVSGTSGTVTLNYTNAWSEDPALYGITVTGSPVSGDYIVVSYNKDADGSIVDGDIIRTIDAACATITILDVLKEI